MPKKDRKSTVPRGSHYENGELYDDKTNQKLYFSTHVCTVFRETLRPGGEPNQIDAMKVLDKNYKKRQAHGTLGVLEDRFTVVKNKSSSKDPFRPWLSYREIVEFQASRSRPEFFVLTVNSTMSHKYYYEVYKCKSKDDVQRFEGFIKQAQANPGCTIRGGEPIGEMPVDNRNLKTRSIADFQISLESVEENNKYNSVYQSTSPTVPMEHSMYSPERERSTYMNVERHPSPDVFPVLIKERSPSPYRVSVNQNTNLYSAPPMRTPSPVASYHQSPVRYSPPTRYSPPAKHTGPMGLDGITYIKYEPGKGAHVANDGPIYMYSASDHNTDYRNGSPAYR